MLRNINFVRHLSRLFLQDSEVTNLDISHNNIGTESFKDLLHALRKNLRTRKLICNECEIHIDEYDTDIFESMSKNWSLIALTLGGNIINQLLLDDIEKELAKNRSISDLILPMIKGTVTFCKFIWVDEAKALQNHKLSLAGKGISNLDFLAKFIRENPQVTGVNVEMDEFQENEIKKVADVLKGNTSKLFFNSLDFWWLSHRHQPIHNEGKQKEEQAHGW